MLLALVSAAESAARHEVPVGAVLRHSEGFYLAQAGNRTIEKADPGAHAEMRALRIATRRTGRTRFPDVEIFTTLEPCSMCSAAMEMVDIKIIHCAAFRPMQPRQKDSKRRNARWLRCGSEQQRVASSQMLKKLFEHQRGA